MTWEDQQSINAFSRLNSTYADIEEDLRIKREEREALDDLSMELELADEDEAVLYRIADTFVSLPHAEALERLEADQKLADSQIDQLAQSLDSYDAQMKQLKVKLYAKFGDNISKHHHPCNVQRSPTTNPSPLLLAPFRLGARLMHVHLPQLTLYLYPTTQSQLQSHRPRHAR